MEIRTAEKAERLEDGTLSKQSHQEVTVKVGRLKGWCFSFFFFFLDWCYLILHRHPQVHHHLRARHQQKPRCGDQDLLHSEEDSLHPCARVKKNKQKTAIDWLQCFCCGGDSLMRLMWPDRLRGSGTAATNMCLVATGVVEAFFEIGIHCWDIAAGAVIIREAGGVLMDVDGGWSQCNLAGPLQVPVNPLAAELQPTSVFLVWVCWKKICHFLSFRRTVWSDVSKDGVSQ